MKIQNRKPGFKAKRGVRRETEGEEGDARESCLIPSTARSSLSSNKRELLSAGSRAAYALDENIPREQVYALFNTISNISTSSSPDEDRHLGSLVVKISQKLSSELSSDCSSSSNCSSVSANETFFSIAGTWLQQSRHRLSLSKCR